MTMTVLHQEPAVRRRTTQLAAHRHLLLLIPDDASDPCRAGGILVDLLAPPLPHPCPLRASEVLRQGHGTHRIRCRQIAVGQGAEYRRRQVHDAHARW